MNHLIKLVLLCTHNICLTERKANHFLITLKEESVWGVCVYMQSYHSLSSSHKKMNVGKVSLNLDLYIC